MIIAIPLAIIVLLSPSLKKLHGCAWFYLGVSGALLALVVIVMLCELLAPR